VERHSIWICRSTTTHETPAGRLPISSQHEQKAELRAGV
jgi:hypothetical protein